MLPQKFARLGSGGAPRMGRSLAGTLRACSNRRQVHVCRVGAIGPEVAPGRFGRGAAADLAAGRSTRTPTQGGGQGT